MRRLLAICDAYASEYDIEFNGSKSKLLVIASSKYRSFYRDMCAYSFTISGKIIQNVNSYSPLGHIITSSFTDIEDISIRRNSLISKANTVICFFKKLSFVVRLKLFMSYCSSMYGCELWLLRDSNIDVFCVAWRKALRRILGLPQNAHSYMLPIVSNSLPIFD